MGVVYARAAVVCVARCGPASISSAIVVLWVVVRVDHYHVSPLVRRALHNPWERPRQPCGHLLVVIIAIVVVASGGGGGGGGGCIGLRTRGRGRSIVGPATRAVCGV